MLPAMRLTSPRLFAASLCLPLALSACNKDTGSTGGSGDVTTDPQKAAETQVTWSVPTSETDLGKTVVAAIDPNTDPCVDFYQYACGGWIEATELPADKPRYGRGFGELSDRNDDVLKEIVEGLASQEGDAAKAGKFYATCMDTKARDEAGMTPLKPTLAKIDKVKNLKSLMKLTGELHGKSLAGVFFSFGPSFDFKQPDLWITDLSQGGTGLPDRSFYLDEQKSAQILPIYTQHVTTMLTFAYEGDKEKAAAHAAKVVAFETELAKIQRDRTELRDPVATYNRLDRAGVIKLAKKLDWKGYWKAIGYPKTELVNVSVPSFVEKLPEVLAAADMEVLKAYMRFHLINGNASDLSSEIDQAAFAFSAMLTGQQQQEPEWKRCLGKTQGAFGDVIGQQFVERAFAGDSRDIAIAMIMDIEAALEAALPNLAWMDDKTREAAIGKAKKVKNKIGYPSKWKSYDKVEVGDSFFDNGLAAARHEYTRVMDKVGGKVDPEEWFMPPSIVNAYYNPLANDINFPAGILQPPFFSADYPKAMNYGAIGMVMGHELTHGFDDTGRKFDGDGVMTEWWAPEVAAKFEEEAACIEKAYSEYEVQPGMFINGKLTLGENIADHGGIREAFTAYQGWVKKNGDEETGIEGITDEQLFFLGYAQSWCMKSTKEIEALLLTVDTHSPAKARVNLPLQHYASFGEVWGCGTETPMQSENMCEVW
jgi:endothelin-converting enzyme/putative endopeptidase